MKRAVLAIAAAFALVAGPSLAFAQDLPDVDATAPQAKAVKPADQAKLDAQAMSRAPTLVAAAKVTCTPTAARYIGSFNQTNAAGKKANFDAIELSCSEGLGYVMAAFEKNGPVGAQDCIAQHTGAKGPNDPLDCRLPGNTPVTKFLQPDLTKANSSCQPTDVRMLGTTPSGKVYEVACTGGMGTIINVPTDGAKPQLMSCFAATGNLACKLTTAAAIDSTLKALATKSDPKCQMEKSRYVMTTVEGDVVEIACAGGTGMMVVAKGADYVSTVPCARANGYQGGCQLSDVKAAQTAEAETYTAAAKKAGFNCDVEKYGIFPPPGGGKEIVELACKNRPDGAVAIFSGSGDDQILNCGRSQVEGYRCTYSKVDAAFPEINGQLAADGKGACKVNAVRAIGVNAKDAFLEVSCSDGDPGWVLAYPRGVAKPREIMSCGVAKASNVGACDLPTNKKGAIG